MVDLDSYKGLIVLRQMLVEGRKANLPTSAVILRVLSRLPLTVKAVHESKIGKTVNSCAKDATGRIDRCVQETMFTKLHTIS
jgi:hypothetical protein